MNTQYAALLCLFSISQIMSMEKENNLRRHSEPITEKEKRLSLKRLLGATLLINRGPTEEAIIEVEVALKSDDEYCVLLQDLLLLHCKRKQLEAAIKKSEAQFKKRSIPLMIDALAKQSSQLDRRQSTEDAEFLLQTLKPEDEQFLKDGAAPLLAEKLRQHQSKLICSIWS